MRAEIQTVFKVEKNTGQISQHRGKSQELFVESFDPTSEKVLNKIHRLGSQNIKGKLQHFGAKTFHLLSWQKERLMTPL